MITNLFGIYGFNFTREIVVRHYHLIPLYTDGLKARRLAGDKGRFHLTGYGLFEADLTPINDDRFAEEVRYFADAMTFCEQQWVITTKIIILENSETPEGFLASGKLQHIIDITQSRPTSGAAIASDSLSSQSRSQFLNLALDRLCDQQFDQETSFRTAFYRNVESWRLREQFIDILYYFVFSGLEALARKKLNSLDVGPWNLGQRLKEFLTLMGFHTTQKEMEKCAAFRNALFHRGAIEAKFKENGTETIIKVSDLPNLEQLLCDVVLKIMGFDDGKINWNRWKDGMPF